WAMEHAGFSPPSFTAAHAVSVPVGRRERADGRAMYAQALAFLSPACCASASVANIATDAGCMLAYPGQPGTRYTLLWQFPCTSLMASQPSGALPTLTTPPGLTCSLGDPILGEWVALASTREASRQARAFSPW